MEWLEGSTVRSQLMVTRVVSHRELNHGGHDHRPAPHGHDGDHVNLRDPNGPYRGIPRNTGGKNTKLSQIHWPLRQSKQILSQEYGLLQQPQ